MCSNERTTCSQHRQPRKKSEDLFLDLLCGVRAQLSSLKAASVLDREPPSRSRVVIRFFSLLDGLRDSSTFCK